MKKLFLVKFWSLLVAGTLCAVGGIYILLTGNMSDAVVRMLLVAAAVQFTAFYLLLFLWYRKRRN